MKGNIKLQSAAKSAYIVVVVLFVALFVYIEVFERTSIYQLRSDGERRVVESYQVKEIDDSTAPIGIRKEYSWTLEGVDQNTNCLGFYLVHHYAQIYLEDELVYSLMPDENNRIAKNVSSNWIFVPIYSRDNGKEIRIVVTPVYNSVRNRKIEFVMGSHYEMYSNCLKMDLSKLALSSLCIIIGLVIVAVMIVLTIQKKTKDPSLIYLGVFSCILGVWRITDTRFSSLLFENSSLVLGYITVGMLFLVTIPLLFYVKESLKSCKSDVLWVVSLIFSVVAFIVLVFQVLGIAELRQMLFLAHIMIIVAIFFTMLSISLCKWKKKEEVAKGVLVYFIILGAAAIADLVLFYYYGSSSGIFYSIIVFLVYTIYLFVTNIADINKKAYTDTMTGLFNKSRWNELMRNDDSVSEPTGVMMLDLNRLKYINDTMGHEAGDKVIFTFSNILRNSIPHSNTICRWGGDEFTVLITDATKEKMESYLMEIEQAVNAYNASDAEPKVYYAAGYALSTELPGLSRKELLKVADGRMYQNKRQWYRENIT